MLPRKSFTNRTTNDARPTRSRSLLIAQATRSAVCESLEPRRLLVTYTVPSDPPHTAAYLRERPEDGQVRVHLDSPDNPAAFTFFEQTGQHVINAGDNPNFLFVDRVRPHWKPTAGFPDPRGIKVLSDAGNATLRIEGNLFIGENPYYGLRTYKTTQIDSTAVRVDVLDYQTQVTGETVMDDGVTNLIIRTSDFEAERHWPDTPNPGCFVNVPELDEGFTLTVDTGAATYTKVELGTGTIVEEALVITGAGYSHVNVKGDEPQQWINKAVVDFGDDSGLGNDLLELGVFCTVTLKQAPGSSAHDIFVKDVDVNGGLDIKPTTLIVFHKSIIDHLNVIEGRAFIKPTAHGTEVDLFEVHLKGRGYIEGRSTSGTFNIDGEVEFYESSAPSTVTTFDILTPTLAQSNGKVTLCFGSNVTALTSSTIADLSICEDATFTLQQRPQPPAPGNSRVLTVRSLFIEKLPDMPMAVLDLKDNAMIIDYSESSPLEEIRQYITHAYDVTGSTHWITGVIPHDGITTSLGDSSIHALGYAENDGNSSTTGGVGYTLFAGRTVDENSVLVRFTFYGDANLDGTVNLQDFNRLAANFGGSGKVWGQGDFNYNQIVNLQDFNRLAANFGSTGLGDAAGVIDEYTYEELEEMLPD